jgi:hypothetical protein
MALLKSILRKNAFINVANSSWTSRFPSIFLSALALLAFPVFFLGCGDEHADASIHIVKPRMGDTVSGARVVVRFTTTDWTYDAGSHASANDPGALFKVAHGGASGHIHIFLDKSTNLDADAAVVLTSGDSAVLLGLPEGKHYVITQGADDAHEALEGMRDSVQFFVKNP